MVCLDKATQERDDAITSAPKLFDVVGLGVSTLDLVMVVDDFPAHEQVQRAESSLVQGGGPVATALVTLARLGCRTAMIDKLGDDWRGRLIAEEFEREGVSTDCLALAQGHTSSIASVLVRKRDAARTIVYSPGDAPELLPHEIPRQAISDARILHLNGRHLQACLAAARLAKELGVSVSFDGGAHRFSEPLRELIGLTDVCIVARQFAQAFSGTEDLEMAGRELLGAGPGVVAITAGSDGSWVFDAAGQSFRQPAFDMDSVVDTTGAGDAYHGAFLCGMLKNYDLERCARFASAVAALNTGKLGGRSALPSFAETQRFLSEYQRRR